MFTLTSRTPVRHDPELAGQTVLVLGGDGDSSAETARRARAEGAQVIAPAFAATDEPAVERLFDELPGQIDHLVLTAGGARVALAVARNAIAKIRPGGTLQLMDRTVAPQFAAALEVALAPVRVRVVSVVAADEVPAQAVLARVA